MTLTPARIATLLEPYRVAKEESRQPVEWHRICQSLAVYLDLIVRWNACMNLTAIRDPEKIVARHFSESLFAGQYLGECGRVLDFGSGAGFPGVPIQILRPDVAVTLAESQGRKSAFLREAVRELGLHSEVWGKRVEQMPADRKFDVVAMRAVDCMADAVQEGLRRAGRRLMILGTGRTAEALAPVDRRKTEQIPLPGSRDGLLLIVTRA